MVVNNMNIMGMVFGGELGVAVGADDVIPNLPLFYRYSTSEVAFQMRAVCSLPLALHLMPMESVFVSRTNFIVYGRR